MRLCFVLVATLFAACSDGPLPAFATGDGPRDTLMDASVDASSPSDASVDAGD